VSAPPLPEIFGNYALGDFAEVVSPDAVSWLPQTVGWRIVAVVLLGLVLYRGWKALRHWYRNRYRREAAVRLRQLSGAGGVLAGDVNQLLKLTALVAFPREQVARLYGEEWTDFLNRQCPAPPFDPEAAQLLALGAYRAVAVEGQVKDALLAASLAWVKTHGNPLDG
jgi:hypothetical protein